MSTFRAEKVVAVLPATLEPDTLYFVRVGAGFDLYASDTTGAVAHKINGSSERELALHVDYAGAQFQYLGYASRIARINRSVSPPSVAYAATSNVNADWPNRAVLTYT